MLELDPRVLEIARSELGFAPTDRIDVRIGDARRSIRALASDSYDLVIGDAFGGLAVPWHLTTTEFLDEVVRVLRPNGTYVANLIDYPPLAFVRAEVATAATRFKHVAVVSARRILDGDDGGNLVLVASDARSTSRPSRRRSRHGASPTRRSCSRTVPRSIVRRCVDGADR